MPHSPSTDCAVTSSSNQVDDVIEGVTLNLKSASTSTVTLTVANDTEAVKSKIEAFVDSYNKAYQFLNSQFEVIGATGRAGTLAGDSTVRAIQSQLASVVSGAISGPERGSDDTRIGRNRTAKRRNSPDQLVRSRRGPRPIISTRLPACSRRSAIRPMRGSPTSPARRTPLRGPIRSTSRRFPKPRPSRHPMPLPRPWEWMRL